LNRSSPEQAAFLDQMGRLTGAAHTRAELKECLATLTQPPIPPRAFGRLALLAGLVDGLSHTKPLLTNSLAGLEALIEMAATTATAAHESLADRVRAIRILARTQGQVAAKTWIDLFAPNEPPEIHSAAARGIALLDDSSLANAIVDHWGQYATQTRRRILLLAVASPALTEAITDGLERKVVLPVEIDAHVRQALLQRSRAGTHERLKRLLQNAAPPDREQVVRKFQPALTLEGRREHGAAIFAKSCLVCHSVQGMGEHVGPDLSGIASRPKEALLVDILDPSRQVSPDFINYIAVTTRGDSVSGFVVSETASAVTLRRAGAADETVLRREIKELRADEKSLMPEGLEQGMTVQEMADLLSFLQNPKAELLPRHQ
jgi:putative heme-binding domain-containing protein